MAKLVMIRHGQSDWNKKNLFTGWVDIPLSTEGIEESFAAGRKIADVPFDVIFVSDLVRAQMTAFLAMSLHRSGKVPRVLHKSEKSRPDHMDKIFSKETEESCIPVIVAWQLNERMYGALQGVNKDEMRKKFGPEQVQIWRRSYDVAPPEGESLQMTAARSIPYFKEMVLPYLKAGKNVAIFAHGNSMRSIIMDIEGLNKEQVVKLELPTGEPFTYIYEHGKLRKGRLDE